MKRLFLCIICHLTRVEYDDEICEYCRENEIDYPEAA